MTESTMDLHIIMCETLLKKNYLPNLSKKWVLCPLNLSWDKFVGAGDCALNSEMLVDELALTVL